MKISAKIWRFFPVFLLLLACEKEEPLPPLEKYQELAELLETGIRSNQHDDVYHKFSTGLFINKLREKIVLHKTAENQVQNIIKSTWEASLKELSASYGEASGGVLDLDTVFIQDRTGHLIFSMLGEVGEVNFIDFHVTAFKDQVYVSDYLSYFKGTMLTDDIHQAVSNFLTNQHDPRNPRDNGYLTAAKLLSQSQMLMKSGLCEEAWNNFHHIEEQYQNNPGFLVWKINIASCLSPEKYIESTKLLLANQLIQEPSKRFHELLLASYQNDIAAFEKANANLINHLGKAKLLYLQKSIFLYNVGEYEGAVNYIERCFPIFEKSFYAQSTKLDMLMGAGRYQAAVACVKEINELFELDYAYFSELFELYPIFMTDKELKAQLIEIGIDQTYFWNELKS